MSLGGQSSVWWYLWACASGTATWCLLWWLNQWLDSNEGSDKSRRQGRSVECNIVRTQRNPINLKYCTESRLFSVGSDITNWIVTELDIFTVATCHGDPWGSLSKWGPLLSVKWGPNGETCGFRALLVINSLICWIQLTWMQTVNINSLTFYQKFLFVCSQKEILISALSLRVHPHLD